MSFSRSATYANLLIASAWSRKWVALEWYLFGWLLPRSPGGLRVFPFFSRGRSIRIGPSFKSVSWCIFAIWSSSDTVPRFGARRVRKLLWRIWKSSGMIWSVVTDAMSFVVRKGYLDLKREPCHFFTGSDAFLPLLQLQNKKSSYNPPVALKTPLVKS